MRETILFNENWYFENEITERIQINLPHTWNARDGQDGGNDYYRGVSQYTKKFIFQSRNNPCKVYLEFRGVNSSATVYLNGKELRFHYGGYSTFRVELTDDIRENENMIRVDVDNAKNDYVYPQKADFTFYGGIYRDVYLILVPINHIELDDFGSSGVYITPELNSSMTQAIIDIKVKLSIKGEESDYYVRCTVPGVGSVIMPVKDGWSRGSINIDEVRLWNGLDDPYLYELEVSLNTNESNDLNSEDSIVIPFGCRTYSFDPEKGFLLNGREYPLCGVSRHQDRKDVGNAITTAMQDEDIKIIREMGANTIRLAHYQHDQYFYQLCDLAGILVWTEIPYISEHLISIKANENTRSQLHELIAQNYNHPSIFTWCLSNEITVTNISDDLRRNHNELNELAHRLDPSRVTSMAHVTFLDIDDPLVHVTDICSYNHYFGWYFGNLEDNEEWFKNFHAKYPNQAIGLSEYGADANVNYQSGEPVQGDYSEQYQCRYHESILQMLSKHQYIWGSYVWNMFDFGADGRNEGGGKGLNQKGLVSFDRKTKKDAFYLYKAYWSKEPFVHICDKRYQYRHENQITITVYSNSSKVELFVEDQQIDEKSGSKVFRFHVDLSELKRNKKEAVGIRITVRACDQFDEYLITPVSEADTSYRLATQDINNWYEESAFKVEAGYYSIKNTIGQLRENELCRQIVDRVLSMARENRGDVAKGLEKNEVLEKLLNNQTLENLAKKSGGSITLEMLKDANRDLSRIKEEISIT